MLDIDKGHTKMKKQTKKSLALAALAIPFAMSSSAFAETSGTTTVNIEVDETLSLVLSTDNINFNAIGGELMTNNMTITGSTNSAAGYSISVNTNNDYTELKHSNTNVSASVPTLSSATTMASFPDIAWGYTNSLANASDIVSNDTTFNPIPAVATKIFQSSANGSSNHIFTTGIKANNSLPAGTYSNDLLFTIVANPVPQNNIETGMNDDGVEPIIDPISGNPYFPMQGMTPEICQAATLEEQVQLIDIRDKKLYWVTKLADGNCWMTQNLDFDIPSTALSSTTTNLTQYGVDGYTASEGYSKDGDIIYWTPNSATIPASAIGTTGTISGWQVDHDHPYSADPGTWYSTDTWYDNDTETNYLAGNQGDKFSRTPYSGNGAHGHVGNYYNWSAAIATNDASGYTSSTYQNLSENPKNSICPKGWRLPVIAEYSNGELGANEFYNLGYSYGSTSNDEHISGSPVWLIRTGWVTGGLSSAGSNGLYWSSTVANEMSAHDLYFHHWGFNPKNYYGKGNGASIRCVAE